MIHTGALHLHSTHSYDGKLTLSELKALFQKNGLSFACMTEHSDTLTPETAAAFVTECRELSDDSFVFVPGFEVPYKNAHVLHVGATQFIAAVADGSTLKEWRSVSPLVVLAHPVRNQFVVDEILAECLDGVEVWNQHYDGKRAPRPRSLELLRSLRQKKDLIATGGIDLHRAEHFGSPLVQLELPELSEASIITALKAGHFTFGNTQYTLGAKGAVALPLALRLKSALSIIVIIVGKSVNAALAAGGLSLPKSLKRVIRGRV